MTELTVEEAKELFNAETGMDATEAMFRDNGLFVRVHTSSAIGKFFQICREHELERDEMKRSVNNTELDGWIKL